MMIHNCFKSRVVHTAIGCREWKAVLLAVTISLVSCSEGQTLLDEIGGDFFAEGSTESGLKDFFVEPLKDSVIAIGNGHKTASIQRSSTPLAAFTDQAPSVGSLSIEKKDIDSGINFDLMKRDLQSCEAYQNLVDTRIPERFQNISDISALANAFAWSSDKNVPLSFAGEFSYFSSFGYSCQLARALSTVEKGLNIQDYLGNSRTLVLSDEPGNFTKATISVEKKGNDKIFQKLNLERFAVRSFDRRWPEDRGKPESSLQFSRAFQSVVLDTKEGNLRDDLRISVNHEAALEAANVDIIYGDTFIQNLGAEGNHGRAALKQKFTLVASNRDASWQGIAFFSSYKYDPRCQPFRDADGRLDYSQLQLTTSESSGALVCAKNYGGHERLDDGGGEEIIYQEIPTDTTLYIAVTDQKHGAYLYRFICSGGHDISADFYDISSCSTTGNETIEYYTVDGVGITSQVATSRIRVGLNEWFQIIKNQMLDYSRAGQFPASVVAFTKVHGEFSESEHTEVIHDPLNSKEYISEQLSKSIVAAPYDIDVVLLRSGNARIDWSTISGASYYKLYRSVYNNPDIAEKLSSVRNNSYVDNNLQANTTYYYWAKSCNDSGCSPQFSYGVSITTEDTQIPDVPQNLVIATETVSSALLTWDTSARAVYYRIYRNTNNNFSNAKRIARTVLPLHKDYGLVSGVSYYYWVEACVKGVCSGESEAVVATVFRSAPQGLQAMPQSVSGTGLTTVLVQWNVVAGVDAYEVRRAKFGQSIVDSQQIGRPGVAFQAYDHFQGGFKLVYWVRACNSTLSQCSAYSEPFELIVPLAPPSSVTAVARSQEKIELNWARVAQASMYHVEVKTGSDEKNRSVYSVSESTLSATITGLELNKKFFFFVKACNKDVCSDFSFPATAKTLTLGEPEGLVAQSVGTEVSLRWSPVQGSQYYQVYRTLKNNKPKKSDLIDQPFASKGSTFSNSGLSAGITYYYFIKACGGSECSGFSSVASATTVKYSLNDTGIVGGSNENEGPHNNSCTSNISGIQDCQVGADAEAEAGMMTKIGSGFAGFDYSRMLADGTEYTGSGDFNIEPWSCVRDNRTGLVWEIKNSDSDDVHYENSTYKWGGSTAGGREHSKKQGDYHDDWNDLVSGSNSDGLCGYNDWRVPTVNELTSILNLNNNSPAIDEDFFPNVNDKTGLFWSASPKANDKNQAWLVSFYDDGDGYGFIGADRTDEVGVRLVRGGEQHLTPIGRGSSKKHLRQVFNVSVFNDWEDSRYTDNKDGTVIDRHTRLMWQKCLHGKSGTKCKKGDVAELSWPQALDAAEKDYTGSYNDWRIANVKELQSLIAYDRHSPSLNTSIFSDSDEEEGRELWTSSPYQGEDGYSWAITQESGASAFFKHEEGKAVRFVRSAR